MAEKKITDLGTLDAVPADADYIAIVDTDDTAQSSIGSTKKVLISRLHENLATSTHTQALTAGGTGEITAQASIDALTQISGGTAADVLTKDSSGNAVWAAAPGASGGEANTASNVESGSGTEVGVFKAKNVADLEFKSLKEGAGITLTSNANDVTIEATAGGDITGVAITAGVGLSGSTTTTTGDHTQTLDVDVGIADTKIVKVDSSTVADDEYARFTASGLESRSVSEVLGDIGASASGHNHDSAYEAVDATIVRTGASSTFTTAQIPSTRVAPFEQPNFDTYQNFVFTLAAGDNTLTTPTTEAGNVGQTGVIVLIQDSGATSTVVWDTQYKVVGGAAPTLTDTVDAVDILPYCIQADNNILIGAPQLDLKATA